MIWFIIGFIISVIVIIYLLYENWWYYDFGEKIGVPLLVLLCSTLASILVFFFASIVVNEVCEIDYRQTSDTKIIALKDNQNISGNFYIFGGYIDEDLYYYYATETEFGYKTEKIKADSVYIKYTDGNAHIEEYAAMFADDYVNLFGCPLNNSRYVIYCPEGTITNEFNIDLE